MLDDISTIKSPINFRVRRRFAIDIEKVSDVLRADGWHHVEFARGKSTFVIDAYDFLEHKGEETDPLVHVSGGTVAGVPFTGAEWFERESGKFICGYMSTNCNPSGQTVYSGGKGVIFDDSTNSSLPNPAALSLPIDSDPKYLQRSCPKCNGFSGIVIPEGKIQDDRAGDHGLFLPT